MTSSGPDWVRTFRGSGNKTVCRGVLSSQWNQSNCLKSASKTFDRLWYKICNDPRVKTLWDPLWPRPDEQKFASKGNPGQLRLRLIRATKKQKFYRKKSCWRSRTPGLNHLSLPSPNDSRKLTSWDNGSSTLPEAKSQFSPSQWWNTIPALQSHQSDCFLSSIVIADTRRLEASILLRGG